MIVTVLHTLQLLLLSTGNRIIHGDFLFTKREYLLLWKIQNSAEFQEDLRDRIRNRLRDILRKNGLLIQGVDKLHFARFCAFIALLMEIKFFWNFTPCWLINRTGISEDINASIFRVKQSKKSWANLAWDTSLYRSLRLLSMLRRVQSTTGAIQPRVYWVLDAHFFKWWGIQVIHASVSSTENRSGWSHSYTPQLIP